MAVRCGSPSQLPPLPLMWCPNFFCFCFDFLFVFVLILFYGLKIQESDQIFRIWQKIGIWRALTRLDWPRWEKLRKIWKQCYQTLFFSLTAFNTQTYSKIHSDQVWRHSISKKYDFGPISHFSPWHPYSGIFFSKNHFAA